MKRKTTKGPARTPAKKQTTALVVRKKDAAPVVRISDPGWLLPQSQIGQLGELATVGALGIAQVKLTPEEEQVLNEPVNVADIRWKPRVKDGPPEIPYLPHIVYTRWFCKAFGRTGWALVPVQRVQRAGNLLMREYLLYIHGVPVQTATGEQEYYESNKQQTYGDVIESLHASALRRCAKHLNVGLEMWDKDFLDRLQKPKGVRNVRREDFHGDVYDAEPARQEPEPQGSSQLDGDVITDAQRQRLAAIVERAGRSAAEVSLWLKKRYGVATSKAIKRADYAEVCRMLEARGSLQIPGDGQ